jgi:hypothetical protein
MSSAFDSSQNRENILILIDNMKNLRALQVVCKNYGQISIAMNDDEADNVTIRTIQWLKDRLSPSIYSITEMHKYKYNLYSHFFIES